MEKINKNKLDNLFDKLQKKEKESNIQAEKRKNKEVEFLQQFKTFCDNTITPIMNEFKEYLSSKKMGCHISYNDDELKGNINPYIKMEISKSKNNSFYSSNQYPHIMFICDKYSKEITIHENTIFPNSGGVLRKKTKKYTIDSLNKTQIEFEITESINNILEKKY